MEILDAFLRVLEEETEVLEDLIAIAREKKQLVVLGKVKELQELLNREARAVTALEKAEAERHQRHEALAQEWGGTALDLRGGQLIEKARELGLEQARELEERIESLNQAVTTLKFLNRENEDLIKQSIAFIQAVERELTGGGATTYTRSGGLVSDQPPTSLVDRKI